MCVFAARRPRSFCVQGLPRAAVLMGYERRNDPQRPRRPRAARRHCPARDRRVARTPRRGRRLVERRGVRARVELPLTCPARAHLGRFGQIWDPLPPPAPPAPRTAAASAAASESAAARASRAPCAPCPSAGSITLGCSGATGSPRAASSCAPIMPPSPAGGRSGGPSSCASSGRHRAPPWATTFDSARRRFRFSLHRRPPI